MAAYGSVLCPDGRRQPPARLEDLKGFRSALYGCATRRADAWFELVDALLLTERLVSLPHLSLEPVCRRGHGSLYAALRHGEVAAERLREVLAAHLPAGPPVFAVDPTVWPRCDAECSPGRGFYYHPSRHSAGQPIEHTIRFWKQTLHWTLPRPRTPEQADRFTWAVAAAYSQLRLARTIVTDLRLPWEQPLPLDRQTPERVRRRFRAVLAAVGTPASAPKPHGRSPGHPQRHPARPGASLSSHQTHCLTSRTIRPPG